MTTTETTHTDLSKDQDAAAPAPSTVNKTEALIKALEADLDFIIYKSSDPRAHEIACAAKRKITAPRASTT